MSRTHRIGVPAVLTAALLAARLAPVPSLSDPVTGAAPVSLHLQTPWLYLVFAPVFTLWDGVSMLSMSRLEWFLIGLAILYAVWRLLVIRRRASWARELKALAASLVLLPAFLVAGALWHRPMLALAGVSPDQLVVDFHSHTNVSHDVRDTWMRGFDREANRRWHARAGFDAAFITDHNDVSRESRVTSRESRVTSRESRVTSRESRVTSRESRVTSRESPVVGPESGATPRSSLTTRDPRLVTLCPGIEVSAWRAHVVLLGDTVAVDRRRYNGSLEALLSLLETSDTLYGALSVASLPEYRRNHWDRLRLLLRAGLDGFEVVNASPKANEITRAERDSVIRLARAYDRFVVGVSDSHGWGATSMVWNLVRKPGAGDTCAAILQQLREGFGSVRIVERHRLRPDAGWPMWLTPVGVVWETWRSMGWGMTVSWLAWIWVAGLVANRFRRRSTMP